jgi:Ca2+-binding EF-hand superfamily protein
MRLTKVALAAVLGLAVPATALANHGDKAEKHDAMFKQMDTNGDGKISADEHAAHVKKMFQEMDANHDGKVTAEEMTAAHEKITGKKAGPGEMSAADKIRTMDTNGDGALSEDEYTAGAKKMFDQIDTDHDGYLTPAEFEAGHKAMMSKDKGK